MRTHYVFIVTMPFLMLGGCKADQCHDLPPCEQYQCRNPEFYCASTLYESGIAPKDMTAAQKIVQDYIDSLGKPGKIGLTTQSPKPYFWFNVDVQFDDGTSYGYEVGPDGNIYEIKRKN